MVALKLMTTSFRWPHSSISRNAVVALKRKFGFEIVCLRYTKQERRGGIETIAGFVNPAEQQKEAGTPWWH